jgi:murein DD-endopeptidase MepM/ murein hydrolase activator NlpD
MKSFSVRFNFRRHALAGIALFLIGALSSVSAQAVDYFDFPIGNPFASNYVVSGFAFLENTKPACGELTKWGFHTGEDWNSVFSGAADRDDPVFAVADGIIEFAGWGGKGWGNVVVIRHTAPDGFPFQIPDPDDGNFKGETLEEVWSQYGHMSSIALNPAAFDRKTGTQREWKPGDFIKRGQQIGTVGDFPAGTGLAYHLHFEIRRFGTDKKEFGEDAISAAGPDANPYVFPCEKEDPQKKIDARLDWVKKHYIWPTKFVELNRATTDSELGFWHLIDKKRTPKGVYPQDVVDISILSPDINPRLVTLPEGDDGKLPHSACGTVMTCQRPSRGLWWYGVNHHTH